MFLEKLEIQGFKSFANKNTLVFPGMIGEEKRGITAIVGPNGSGKSNAADAVRWVLGEQSMKTLRGKKSEDVIFSGSDKKSKLSMAEVSLFLNNEDGRAPIDYGQVVLTRRLFRDGNSEYLINNSRVRLGDIQMMLAKASFGQKTYSVIGQGMVEGFLNTSLSERKEFFDEATGVKQFQIKRDDSLNKLLASYENLNQAQMILVEIEPRLRGLTKQVNKLQRRGELESELKELQVVYYRNIWHDINDKFNKFNQDFLQLEKVKLEKDKKLENFNQKLGQIQRQQGVAQEFNELQSQLVRLQNQKDQITRRLARIDAQLEIKLEAGGQFDLSWLKNKNEELNKEAKILDNEINNLKEITNSHKAGEQVLINQKAQLNDQIRELNNSMIKNNVAIGDEEINKINQDLKKLFVKLEQAEIEADLAQVKIILAEIKNDLKVILELSGKYNQGEKLETVHVELIKLTELREEISIELNQKISASMAQSERQKMLLEKRQQIRQEIFSIENKLKQHQNKLDLGDVSDEQSKLKAELISLEMEIEKIKEKISSISQKEATERAQIFEVQSNIHDFQIEINRLSGELNNLKINSTRFETRLEDLENEIRNEFGSLKEIKQTRSEGHVEIDLLHDKIASLKKQLDLIGGIDPEIEKEYIETKERFDFLTNQINDLESAIGSLEKVIKELDVVIKEKFDKEFKIISVKFEEYFKILFNGGTAKIIKVIDTEEDPADVTNASPVEGELVKEKKNDLPVNDNYKKIKYLQKYNATGLAGIEIQATPPGKKIKSVAMLSGGERALTAIALICAIINVNPSPFVVLDEVDAALDEANSERLAKILDDLSYKTQFIVITHNRASMRKANVLYGVTMGDDGVSRLLSIKLEEVKLDK
ncbi:MAG: hypothetical protein US81_C0001G0037 [Parcubacteria group bacterium GW2011_GWE2_38_18]|nr:MAG: hypothetical protein US81_C0001G0037 [Parcubacteria group bacterium GW2011_GWE2_38_18]